MKTKDIPPFPAAGQSMAAPKTEGISFIVIFIPVMFIAFTLLAFALVQLDKSQRARTRKETALVSPTPTPQRLINNTIIP